MIRCPECASLHVQEHNRHGVWECTRCGIVFARSTVGAAFLGAGIGAFLGLLTAPPPRIYSITSTDSAPVPVARTCGRVYLDVSADKGRRCTMPAGHSPAAGCCHTHEALTAAEVAEAQRQWMASYEAGIARNRTPAKRKRLAAGKRSK